MTILKSLVFLLHDYLLVAHNVDAGRQIAGSLASLHVAAHELTLSVIDVHNLVVAVEADGAYCRWCIGQTQSVAQIVLEVVVIVAWHDAGWSVPSLLDVDSATHDVALPIDQGVAGGTP